MTVARPICWHVSWCARCAIPLWRTRPYSEPKMPQRLPRMHSVLVVAFLPGLSCDALVCCLFCSDNRWTSNVSHNAAGQISTINSGPMSVKRKYNGVYKESCHPPHVRFSPGMESSCSPTFQRPLLLATTSTFSFSSFLRRRLTATSFTQQGRRQRRSVSTSSRRR